MSFPTDNRQPNRYLLEHLASLKLPFSEFFPPDIGEQLVAMSALSMAADWTGKGQLNEAEPVRSSPETWARS